MTQQIKIGGQVHSFPDDASEDDIRQALEQMSAAPKAGPMFSNVKRSALLGTRQAIEGLASPLTFVGDATNTLLNLPIKGVNAIAGTEIPEFGMPSQALNRMLIDSAGFPEEQNDTERLVGAVNKGATGGMVTAGAGFIPSLMRAAPGATAALRINPGSQVVGGMTGATAAEGTRQGLQDVRLFDNDTADQVTKGFLQLLAGVAGGTAGYLGSRGVVNAGQSIKNTSQGAVDLFTTTGRERIAGQVLKQASGDPTSLAARLSDVPPSKIPGVQPTTAQALGGDPQLSALELGIRNDPAYRHSFDVRAAENQTARTSALEGLAPAGAGSVEDLAAGIKAAWSQADEAGRAEIIAAQNRAADRIAALGQTVDPQRAGSIIREELQAAHREAKGQTKAAYRAIDPNNSTSLSGPAVYDRVAPLIEQYFANSTAGTPEQLRPILGRLRLSGNLPLAQLDGIRQDLGNIASQAARAGDDRLASVAGEMADTIGVYADDAAAAGQGFTPEQAAAYQNARTQRRQQGETFERGAVGATLKRGQYGEHRVPTSGVPAELFFRGSGSPEAAQQFVQAAGGRPRALKALEDHIGTQLRQSVTRPDGTIDPNRLLKFISDHRGALDSFPELRTRIGSVVEAQAAVDRATLSQTARQSELSGNPLNQFLTKNPTEAVQAIIGSHNSEAAVGQVMNTLRGNTQALAAFKRSVLDWFQGKIETAGIQPVSGDAVQSYAKVKTILDSKLPTLRKIFDKNEIKTLQNFAAQMADEARVTSAKPLGSNTFSNMASRYMVERMTNSMLPMMGPNTVSNLANIPGLDFLFRGTNNAVRQSLNEALLDPAAASRMVGRASDLPTKDAMQALQDTVRALFIQSGLQAQNDNQRRGLMFRPELPVGPMGLLSRPGPLAGGAR